MIEAHSIDLELPAKLKDKDYRRQFFWAETSAEIASALVRLRKRRGLNQKQLAEEVGTKQPAISRVEQADYQNWNLNTLRSIADALDARIRVLIQPYEEVVREYEAPSESIVWEPPNALSTEVSPTLPWLLYANQPIAPGGWAAATPPDLSWPIGLGERWLSNVTGLTPAATWYSGQNTGALSFSMPIGSAHGATMAEKDEEIASLKKENEQLKLMLTAERPVVSGFTQTAVELAAAGRQRVSSKRYAAWRPEALNGSPL
jgi:transcriptional regulator with XRE-family HTH domain